MINQAYVCGVCGKSHEGPPFSYGTDAPDYWHKKLKRDKNSHLDAETCVIQAQHFFVRARLIIEVEDADEDFVWGVWVSLSRDNFSRMMDLWTTPGRESEPAYFGWLSTTLPAYAAPTRNLKTRVYTDPVGTRPHVLVEHTDHPLAVEQHAGITVARVREIADALLHGAPMVK